MIGLTTTYHKIKKLKAPIKLIQGGQGAGKNYALALIMLEKAQQGARVITIVTDTYDNLKDGIITDYENIFQWSDLNFYDYYNKQEKVLYWGNAKIQFRYIADHKQQAGKSKRRDVLYVNEGNKMGWAAIEHYIARSGEIYVDFNPDHEFWAHTELEPREDCEKIVVTYRDNELCPENEVRYIESRKDNEEWYRVYGLGLTGTYSDRRIYSFEIVDEVPSHVKRIPSGMDFGKSPDPTCKIDLFLDGIDLYLDEVFTMNNLLPEKIKGAERPSIVDHMDFLILEELKGKYPNHFKHEDSFYLDYDEHKQENSKITPTPEDLFIRSEIRSRKDWMIIGDSAGKAELIDLRKHGYEARGVKKKPGSIDVGIKRLRSYNLKITKRSTNLIKGAESWFWKVDSNGKIVPEPDGHEPDGLAASRYVMLAKNVW